MVDLADLAREPLEEEPLHRAGATPPSVGATDRKAEDPTPEPTPKAEPAASTTWIELEVVHETGARYPQVPVTVLFSDGSSRTLNLDARSRCRIDAVPEGGTYRVELPEELGAHLQEPGDGPIEMTGDEQRVSTHPVQPVPIHGGTVNRIVVERPRLHVLEAEEVSFGFDRAVLLPDVSEPKPHEPGEAVPSGLDVVAGALRFAKQHPDKRLLLTGHTDARGSASFNLALARERSTNVYLYLVGDHAQWASHCSEHAADDDVQRILRWVCHSQREFACDPGAIDGDFGPKSRDALDQFRATYLETTGTSLPSGPPGPKDWQAFAEMYDRELIHILGFTWDELRECRESLGFLDPPIVGFGEAYARNPSSAKHALRAEDRRVDVLFFDPREMPKASGESLGELLYGKQPGYKHEPLFATPRLDPESIGVLLLDEEGLPVVSAPVEITTPDGRQLEAQLDEEGRARVAGLNPGTCRVSFPGLDATAWFAAVASPRDLPTPPSGPGDEYIPDLPNDDLPDVFDEGEDEAEVLA